MEIVVAGEKAQKPYIRSGRESLTLSDAAVSTLTVPADTEYAEIQVIGGTLVFTIDGATTPTNTATAGNIVHNCGYFKLGRGDSDNQGDIAEVTDFQGIAFSGSTPRLEINYFKKA